MVDICRTWAAKNVIKFTEAFDVFLACDNAVEEMTKVLLAYDPFDLTERLVNGDQTQALELYFALHTVILELLWLPC
jgi:hypothetical protein